MNNFYAMLSYIPKGIVDGPPFAHRVPQTHIIITSRGNERNAVFKSRQNRVKLIEYLDSTTEHHGACMHVNCLMDNHYHQLMQIPQGNLPRIMRHLNGVYTCHKHTVRNYKQLGNYLGLEILRFVRLQKIEQDKQLNKIIRKLDKTKTMSNVETCPLCINNRWIIMGQEEFIRI